ncbi:T9SS type A sorting domain-containing protein [Flammeovirga yaeyamensis]|uniref:T9SS type A sorting domain-containing protein n=1 Tax=Flammeovirga yaeyamensis TaxID=367791 RepID=A0AAX1NBJ2_9BACT|nr:T9SS type A sorting domain-containing protein [Flammeovirga yaeyamensis]MBB3697158.1 hypothetical protein [Flammeovirga yaeyamensis]NMF33818.1 T9SS type A sorting domain-containing protein [Flammeovirga yaeyamensis]QWG04918.1 T9SS type A sorting domain-containing protein [Flammeovirga yaeyamensis]
MKSYCYLLFLLFLISSCADNNENNPSFVPIELSTYTKTITEDTEVRGSFANETVLVSNNSTLTINGATIFRCFIEVEVGSRIVFSNTTDMREVQLVLHGDDQMCVSTEGITVIINEYEFTNIEVGCYDDEDLPVELISFTSEIVNDDEIVLNWSTATEINSAFFEVQRSYDQKQWNTLDSIQAAGNSNVTINYSYRDTTFQNINGVVYHRLNQVDLDGNNAYYGPVAVKLNDDESNEVTMYPNPVAFGEYLNIVTTYDNFSVKMYDSTGKTYYDKSFRGNFTSIPMYFGTGLLIVEVKSGSRSVTEKIVVQ